MKSNIEINDRSKQRSGLYGKRRSKKQARQNLAGHQGQNPAKKEKNQGRRKKVIWSAGSLPITAIAFSRQDAKAQSFKAILGALGGFAREYKKVADASITEVSRRAVGD
ncbi:MAG: hypothetical protein ACQERN_09665 [Thermodesulfobacteriota bacterium]